jgi:folate-dependent phosphoribosylglycinamide formyltransferase PurN
MSEPTTPIRVCLLVDGRTIREWQHRALQRMVDETAAEITVVVSNQRTEERSIVDTLKRAVELREWTVVWLLRSLLAKPVALNDPVRVDEQASWADATWIDCEPERVDGWKNRIPTEMVDRITDRADVAIRFGFGFLIGPLLTELEYGVLSYHHGDFREYRGQPAGCWEFIHGRSEVGITLQRISEQLDAGEAITIKSVPIEDARTYAEIRGRLYAESDDLLATAMANIENGDLGASTVGDLGPLYTIPRGPPAFQFFVKELQGMGRRLWEEWSI